LTANFVVLQENFDSIASYYSNSDLSLNWNLVFTLPVWLRVWWQYFASDAELYLRSVMNNDKIIGIAPLQIKEGIASIIGSINVCDYQDFIISPGDERDFFNTLLNDLKQKGVKKLHLGTFRPDSTIAHHLIPISNDHEYQVDCFQTDVSSDITLPSTWDEYLNLLESKQRHELKRKMRHLHEFGDIVYKSISDRPLIPDTIDTFLDLFPESRRDKAEFLTSNIKNFFRSLAISLSENNRVGFGVLESAGRPLAMVMYFDYNNNIYLYNSAYVSEYKSFSVGMISKALCLQDSILKGKHKFDFLKGSEKYKFNLGGKEIPLYCCEITIR
jgi:CelD/BcsL family acetyltransferase involved in cellulose biosynthesis